MIGNLNVAGDVFLAGRYVREHRSQQVIRSDALNLRGDFLSALKTEQGKRAICIPPPARSEDGGSQCCLLQHRLHSLGVEKVENIAQREAVLLGQCDIQAVVRCRGLQLKIEAAAETLAQRQSPGLVNSRSERSMNNELHASAFLEEALSNDGALGRNISENSAALENVLDGLGRSRFVHSAFLH